MHAQRVEAGLLAGLASSASHATGPAQPLVVPSWPPASGAPPELVPPPLVPGGRGREGIGGRSCRFESLDSLQHLSADGFARPWLPSYANASKVCSKALEHVPVILYPPPAPFCSASSLYRMRALQSSFGDSYPRSTTCIHPCVSR